MNKEQFRNLIVEKQRSIVFESQDDEGAAEFYGELGSIIDAIDNGLDVRKACEWVGEPCLLDVASEEERKEDVAQTLLAKKLQDERRDYMLLVSAAPEMLRTLENALDQFNPRECNCDGEYIDGRVVGHACYFHRIEDDLRSAIAKARGPK